ncbi:transmembrane protein 14B [Homo sapiens]|uniref:Transmembrane protein 14B n=5 Tax=Hominidae TaxID=9604 RepID=C9JDJ4_HUMAN|nr:transmembrane protein 14B [Homo sapiens]KAI4016808.1 transmembrane protein 14B [Homo sapiens]PNJ71117.1 TMEM14B isoform 14 [Pongo abelii]
MEKPLFPFRYICYFCWCYGNEILLLWKIHACRFNCRCQFADGRQSWSSYVDDI